MTFITETQYVEMACSSASFPSKGGSKSIYPAALEITSFLGGFFTLGRSFYSSISERPRVHIREI